MSGPDCQGANIKQARIKMQIPNTFPSAAEIAQDYATDFGCAVRGDIASTRSWADEEIDSVTLRKYGGFPLFITCCCQSVR